MRLRVATYNIRKCIGLDWRRKPERVLAVIDALEADVIALQEADTRFGARVTTLSHVSLGDAGWRAVPLAMHDGGIGFHGNAVLVREGVEILAARRIELPALEPRGAVASELSLNGVAFRVVGTHLGLTRDMRMRQVRTIVRELDGMPELPTLVMGDMNAWHPKAPSLAPLSERFRFARPLPTFHATRPVAPLDRIAVSEGVQIVRTGVRRRGWAAIASDHLPLRADVIVGEPGTL